MQGDIFSMLQSLAPLAASVMIVAALAILWRGSRSVWLIVALAAEVAGLIFRGVIAIAPEFTRATPLFFTVWMLCSLIFAGGLLGYALEVDQRRST